MRIKSIVIAVVFLGNGVILAAEIDRMTLRYNHLQWKASHNSYAHEASVGTQLADWAIRSIEFDLHVEKKRFGRLLEEAPPGDFLVYHQARDDFSNCHLLSECLAAVTAFHDHHPDHEVITIFFDMKGIGAPGHTRDDLYALFRHALPPGSIFKPADLLAACPEANTLQQAVILSGCGWPLLSDLRGKFILVVSDGRQDIKAAGYNPGSDLLFLVSKSSNPWTFSADPDVVFFNFAGPDPLARTVWEKGFVSRCYWLDTEERYLRARAKFCHHLATDALDPALYPWSVLSPLGLPFALLPAESSAP